jgi:hypothetical protein
MFLGNFTAIENLQLKTMNQFFHTQDFWGLVTTKNLKERWALQALMEEQLKVMHVLAESQPQLIQLVLDDQLIMFEYRIDNLTSAI